MKDGRTDKITFTCTPDLKNFLVEWATRERRSLSNLVEGIVSEAVQSQPIQTEVKEVKKTSNQKGSKK